MIIFGIITAGDTAATTVPVRAASAYVIPKRSGANATIAHISKHAGTKHINAAGLPIFFKSVISRESPALSTIITSAICLRSDESESIDPSIRFSA